MRESDGVRVEVTVLALRDGRRLAYGEYGDPHGLPVIAFHGTPGGRHQLALLEEDARAAGVRLVVPDRPGYGDSDFVPRRRLAAWSDDVTVLADHLGLERFAVLGVSGGGPHALACAAALGPRVTATAVVSGVAPFTWDNVAAQLRPGARPLAALITRTVLLRLMIAVGLWLLRVLPAVVLAGYRRWLPAADVAVLDLPGVVDRFLAGARRFSRTAARAAVQDVRLFTGPWGIDLAAIAGPVEVWHGDADKTVPVEHGRWLAAQVPVGAFHECPGDGHLCLVTRAPEVFAALRRLADASGEAPTSAPGSA